MAKIKHGIVSSSLPGGCTSWISDSIVLSSLPDGSTGDEVAFDDCMLVVCCKQEKHLRDKFRMQHSDGAVSTADGHASSTGSDSARKHDDGVLSSAAIECISSEEIRPLDRSPQHSVVVRGRRDSGGKNTAETTSLSQINAAVDNSKRSTEVMNGNSEKVVSGEANARSPVQVVSDNGAGAVDRSSVMSPREGGSEHARLSQSRRVRASGHVSDAGSRQHATNDCHSRRSTSASVARRGGYVSDSSFSATEPPRSTAAEGV